MGTLNGEPLLSASITMLERGPWQADVEADTSRDGAVDSFAADAITGRVRVVIEHEGERFVGSVLPAQGTFRGSRYQARVVGGAGGLTTTLPARSYLSALGLKVSQILGDILRESGESLSPTVLQALLDRRLPRWSRIEASAGKCIDRLVKAIGGGTVWRVLRDGTVWIGADAFADAELDAVSLDTSPEEGTIRLAATEEGAGPLALSPGQAIGDARVLEVVHEIRGTLRTEARTATLDRAVDAILDRKQQEIDYSRVYAATVREQNPDGTVVLTPDDPKIAGQGVDQVPILLGVPGTVEIPEGSRCTILFEGGDAQKPRALLWSSNALTMLMIGSGAAFVARADRTDARLAQLQAAFDTHVAIYNAHVHGGITAGLASTLNPATPDSPVGALDSVAADKLKTD